MDLGNSGPDLMKKVKANRVLQRKRRKQLEKKCNDWHQMNNVCHYQVFNTDFLDQNRPEILENRGPLAKELKRIY